MSMAKTRKVTYTLDANTADQIDRSAARIGIPKSAVVREAVSEYVARPGRLTESERARLLAAFDELIPKITRRSRRSVDKELAEIRESRRNGWRREPPDIPSAPRSSKKKKPKGKK